MPPPPKNPNNSYLIQYTKINLKWSVELNIRAKIVKLLEQKHSHFILRKVFPQNVYVETITPMCWYLEMGFREGI